MYSPRMDLGNIHPLIVHFPIALLTFYAALEIIRVPLLTRRDWWFPLKAAFLFVGFLGGLAALQTGDWASAAYRGSSAAAIVEWHERFAQAALICFGVLAAAHLAEAIARIERVRATDTRWWATLLLWERRIFRPVVLILLAAVAFGLLLCTGALGGSLVYGTDIDPLAGILYTILHLR
jgi:uncharacterized membrane protein